MTPDASKAPGLDNNGNIILKKLPSLAKSPKGLIQTFPNKKISYNVEDQRRNTSTREDKADMGQYRLISLFVDVSKVLEKAILRRLYSIIETF